MSASLRPSSYATQLTSMGRHNKHFFGTSHAGNQPPGLEPGDRECLRRARRGERARAPGQGHHQLLHRPARFPAPDHVQEAAIRAIKSGKHGYTPSAGIDELREAAARYLAATRGGLPIRLEDVVVGAGAKPFIAYAVLSTTDYGAGDEVIYPNPGFPIYESQIVASGAKPVPIHLREARRFAFDLTDLEKLITPKTRLLILNYPHNPTGGLLSRKELEEIAAILRGHPQVW